MKECPQCKTTYSDETLNFCLADGTALVEAGGRDPETIPYPGANTVNMNAPSTGQQAFGSTMGQGPAAPAKRGCMGPAIIGIIALLVLGGLVAVGIFAFMKFGTNRGLHDDAPPTPTRTPTSTSSPSKWDSPGASPSPSGSPKSTSTKKGEGPLTKDMFAQIKTGMTYEEMVEIIGFEGEEITMSETGGFKVASYQWKGENYSMIIGVFMNDKLQSKSQSGLK